jgi:hypothetical protein
MAKSIHCVRVNHPNVVLENYEASLKHFEDVYDAEFLLDLRNPTMNACLINIGDVIFELFAPPIYLVNSRYGPHYLGIEYQANMTEVRETLKEFGIRIVRDIDVAVHVHPADCLGIAFEFWDGYFHQNEEILRGHKMRPASYWPNGPLGLRGLKAYTVAVHDLDRARDFLERFINAKVVYETERPSVGGRAIGLQVADAVIEIMTPTRDGSLKQHLAQYNDGIRSVVYRVGDIEKARKYFKDRKVPIVDGVAPNSIAVPPEANLGVIFEFAE